MTESRTTDTFDILLNLVVMLIAPVFFGVTGGNVMFAQAAARQTIKDYGPQSHADLLAVAQIVCFSLAAVGSLSLSMAGDLPMSMLVRLRGNGISCNRAAEKIQKARLNPQRAEPAPQPAAEPAAKPAMPEQEPPAEPSDVQPQLNYSMFLSPEAEQMLAAESQARLEPTDPINAEPASLRSVTHLPGTERYPLERGDPFAKDANDTGGMLRNPPSAQRNPSAMRTGLMNSTACDTMNQIPVPPFSSRVIRPDGSGKSSRT